MFSVFFYLVVSIQLKKYIKIKKNMLKPMFLCFFGCKRANKKSVKHSRLFPSLQSQQWTCGCFGHLRKIKTRTFVLSNRIQAKNNPWISNVCQVASPQFQSSFYWHLRQEKEPGRIRMPWTTDVLNRDPYLMVYESNLYIYCSYFIPNVHPHKQPLKGVIQTKVP